MAQVSLLSCDLESGRSINTCFSFSILPPLFLGSQKVSLSRQSVPMMNFTIRAVVPVFQNF